MTFDQFLQEACPPLDLVCRSYRRRSARHRVDDRLGELGLRDYAAYLDRLGADPEEAAALGDLMRVTVTRFFRERARWDELATIVLPRLMETAAGPRLWAWSAGCCGGEEPYTLSLSWSALPRECTDGRTLEILATDIDTAALERAERAIYQDSSLEEVPDDLRAVWFTPVGPGRWRLDPAATRPVRLKSHNLMEDPPPTAPTVFDLVLCRYLVFTYYQGSRRAEAVRRLAGAVRPGGALMIGSKESLAPIEEAQFAPWPGTRAIYRRTRTSPVR